MDHLRPRFPLLIVAILAAFLVAWHAPMPARAAEHLCSDYTYQEDAQARINDYPATLDPDGDGIACEELPSRMAAAPAPAAPAPAAVPSTGVGTTSYTGDQVLPLLAAALVALMAMSVRLRSRRA